MSDRAFLIGGIGTSGDYLGELKIAIDEAGAGPVRIAGKGLFSGALHDSLLDKVFQVALCPLIAWKERSIPKSWRPLLDPRVPNLIGYSFGALVAAQAASRRSETHHLVLIGAPIGESFLAHLRNSGRIRNVHVFDLAAFGDPLRAGMSAKELLLSIPTLILQFARMDGHFTYAATDRRAEQYRRGLARALARALAAES